MPQFTDQTGRIVTLPATPCRIISLVPSQTELLFDLGLNDEVIGITKFCVHPDEWFRSKTRIGGTKELKIEQIRQLQPDLLIANKEENVKEQVEELSKEFPVWVSDINNLEDAYEMIRQIGVIANREKKASSLTSRIKDNFSRLRPPISRLTTCYLIWQKPYMSVGADTFIHDMLEKAGFDNLFRDRTRYPETSIEELQRMNCQLLLLSSEPFPFKQKQLEELQRQLPGTRILLVDGELFSWYGSRLLKAPAYFQSLQDKIAELSR